jgi:hypothetical protein
MGFGKAIFTLLMSAHRDDDEERGQAKPFRIGTLGTGMYCSKLYVQNSLSEAIFHTHTIVFNLDRARENVCRTP